MASQDPSTAYTAAPEKKSGSFFSSFPSFSLPKLPDFFGTGAPAPAPAAPATAVAEQSSVQPGGRRRRGGVLPKNKPAKPATSKSQLNPQREMIKLAVKNSMKQKAAKGGRRSRQLTKKAGRRRRHTRRGGDDEYKPDITFVPATPVSFPPTQVRRPTGRGRRTRRGGVETPMQKMKYGPKEYKFLTDGYKLDFPPTQVRVGRPNVESPPVQAPKPTGKGRRTHRVKKHSRR